MVSMVLLQRRCRNRTLKKVACIIAVSIIAFNEFLVYSIQGFRWPIINLNRDPNEELVVLFASDPQLIGIQDEFGFPIGQFARWDSDRYLRNTFSRVYAHARPDVIVFLGDIMDEGSKATQYEYESYMSRFKSIFQETDYTKTIIVPGDNDIGGEGRDFRTHFKIQRFEKHFENLTGVVNHHFVDFIKLDLRMNGNKVAETKRVISSLAPSLKATLRLLVNHEMMLTNMKGSIYPILRMVQPNMLFSGHWHVSELLSCATCLSEDADVSNWPVMQGGRIQPKEFTNVDLNNMIAINEIMVPTCSYRMGVPHMGYGIGIFKNSGSLQYTVLWQPSRYNLLYLYIITLVIAVVLLLLDFILSPTASTYKLSGTHR